VAARVQERTRASGGFFPQVGPEVIGRLAGPQEADRHPRKTRWRRSSGREAVDVSLGAGHDHPARIGGVIE